MDLTPGRRGGASHRASDLGAGGQQLPRHRLAGWGSGWRVHRALQRPSAGPPPWHLYQFTFHTVIGLSTTEPDGATRWRFSRRRHLRPLRPGQAAARGHTQPPPAGRSTGTAAAKAIWPGGPSAATGICHRRSTLTHRTVAYRPGKVSEILTEHYRRAHPEALGLPSR